jgi:hypothetical protein
MLNFLSMTIVRKLQVGELIGQSASVEQAM